ncbi:MAG TPA: putative maltokinase, partial [Kofleriaceae bacterium]|nr:putative maltokinase [Kofleriaceae bacterium]
QWSGDRNAGFSRANPQKLYLPVIIDPEYHFEALNVEAQQNNPSSLLWWMKRLIALRKQYRVFGRGTVEFLRPENTKVLVFIRADENERVLVVANLSRFPQHVELDLSSYEGMVPVELFGKTEFPEIGELPYFLTLGPHSFYWFSLEAPRTEAADTHKEPPVVEAIGSWEVLCQTGRGGGRLDRALPGYLMQCRWFRGKARKISGATISEAIPIAIRQGRAYIAMVTVSYVHETPQTYVLPLAFARGRAASTIEEESPQAVVARVRVRDKAKGGDVIEGILYDASFSDAFADALLASFGKKRAMGAAIGKLETKTFRAYRALRGEPGDRPRAAVLSAEQSNTSIVYGDRFILKLFRMLEEGENPDLEIGRQLTEVAGFPHTPPVAGAIIYRGTRREPSSIGILQGYVRNQGDAWKMTLESLGRFCDRALSAEANGAIPDIPTDHLLTRSRRPVAEAASEVIGDYLAHARLLGERTAEMHIALATETDDPAFAPDELSTLHQRSAYETARTRLTLAFEMLKKNLSRVPEPVQPLARETLSRRGEINARFRRIVGKKIDAVRIRCHGDYHLGQVLYTGSDFVILDFEGEPARPIGERRIKRSPLRDVAGLLRSFHYAAVAVTRSGIIRPEDVPNLSPWLEMWAQWVASTCLGAYLEIAAESAFLPADDDDLEALLDFYLLEKCMYELGYELNNRPDWVGIPLRGLRTLLGAKE